MTCNLQTLNAAPNTKAGNTDVNKMIIVQIQRLQRGSIP